jgi:hypothetical protein
MKSVFDRAKYYGVRFGVVFGSAYIALFLVEIVLWRMEPKQYLRELYRNLYETKDGRGVLKPGYAGRFDDGFARGEVRVNSRGYRGHEPGLNPKWRILLLGDSFAFGALLDQKDTIDARMEEKEPGLEVDNLGVSGYNLPEQLGPLRDWTLPANQVVYLFFYNDLQPPGEMKVVDGYLIPARRGDGTPVTDEEARAKIRSREKQNAAGHRFKPISSISLPRVRQLLESSIQRFRNRRPSPNIDLSLIEKDHTHLVPRSLAYTREMRDLVVQRNMGFQIAMIPTMEEVTKGSHYPVVAEYLAGIKSAGIPVIDLLPKLSTDDYWSHDTHFNPRGAQVAADEIYKALKSSSPQAR